MLRAAVLIAMILVQSSGSRAQGEGRGLPQVVRQGPASEDLISEIVTPRTRAYLSCESGEMVVKINFTSPFRGVVYADYDRASPCRVDGDGRRYYELRISLRGCGTRQSRPRVFVNNIVVRFHKSLELEEDEIKTIECRYPPPLAPPPNNVVAPIDDATTIPPVIIVPKLSEVEILLIICALLFVTLLVLGISIAYFCLKKRNIKVVKRKKVLSSGPGSEITKLSGSTLSMFDPIRIPRATTMAGSALLISGSSSQNETIPSDYPSESPSSVNSDFDMETDGRRSEASFYRDRHMRIREESARTSPATSMDGHLLVGRDRSRFTKFIGGDAPSRLHKDAPVYARIKKKADFNKPPTILESIPDAEFRSDTELTLEVPSRKRDTRQVSMVHLKSDRGDSRPHVPEYTKATVTDFYKTSKIISEEIEESTTTKRKLRPSKEPSKVTLQNIDELYLTKMTEVEESEDTMKELRLSFKKKLSQPHIDQNSNVNLGFRSDESQMPPQAPKWDVLFRIMPPQDFNAEDERKLRTLVNTDTVFRSMIEEAKTEEDLVRITKTKRYSQIFDPKKWEVIIRILSPPSSAASTLHSSQLPTPRFVKNKNSTMGSRRSSSQTDHSLRDIEVRSLTEMDVDFTRADRESSLSGSSMASSSNSPTATARPALERSSTEILIQSPIYHKSPSSSSSSQSTSGNGR